MTCDEVELCEQIIVSPDVTLHAYPRPDYSKKFRCLAEACDENCCNGWSIPIDRRTLEAYRQHPTLRPFTDALVVLNTASPSTGNAASMPLNHNGTCAFLNEEKLCGIHAHFGPSLLSDACATYPREIALQSGHPEAALNLSCPEAARLTLLNPSLLGSGPWQSFGPRRYAHLPKSTRLPHDFDPILALREFTLLILTDPTYLLWQRLHLLGKLTGSLESLAGAFPARQWAESHPAAIASLIAQLAQDNAHHLDPLPAVTPNPTLQLRFTAGILRTRLAAAPVPERFLATVQTFQSGLGCDPHHPTPVTDTQITQKFAKAYRHHVRPLLDRHPELIENFLANHIFKHAYPFGRSQNGTAPAAPNEQHLTLVAHLALTQTLLIGLAAHHRERLAPDHVVRLIQSLSKAIEHRPASVAHLNQSMHDLDLKTPTAQAQLLQLA
jgi:lysine-N-methylase